MTSSKIILAGGAGLVGQNLVIRLKNSGHSDIVVIDKHRHNLDILRRTFPGITTIHADLAEPGAWQASFADAKAVVMLQAQIGGTDYNQFVRNNIDATKRVIEAIKAHDIRHLVHVSSSVVQSSSNDFYTETKKAQETLVIESGIPCAVLRPTLMFGWFDRKHLGWLSRFMKRVPVFPIPGNGSYIRQPLYVGDFAKIIISCIEQNITSGIYDISGHEKIEYIEMIREIKRATGARTFICRIPYRLFHGLLWLWACFDKNPPFTTQQLAALVARDEFAVTDWPGTFGVPCTPFTLALQETMNDPRYSNVILEF